MPKIPKLTKNNAIMVLTDILSEFRSVTGEYTGAVFSWHGKLGSLGPEKFQSYITGNSAEISRTLLTNQISTITSASSKPVRDHEILKLLDGDISSYNVQGLRRLVSAIIKVSTGKGMFFWNDPSLKPPFWPERVPFENRKSACKIHLRMIIESYKDYSMKARVSVRPQSQKSPSSSQASRHDIYRDRSRSPLDFARDVIHQESDVDTSDDSFDELFQQPVIASNKPISDPQTPTQLPVCLNEKNLSISELSSRNTFLTGTTINAFCTLLKKNFPHLQGLQDTILFENRQFVKAPRPSMQLHHDGALHWVCSSIDVEGHVTLYDSLSTGRISDELAVQLAFLYENDADHELKVALAPIQQQRGGADCGLFAAAVCLTIATGGDPTQVYWKQSRMRSYLTDCFNSEILIPFPKIESIVLRSRLTTNLGTYLKIKLWCLCHLPSCASKNMIECPKCLKWFHKPCVGLEDIDKDIDNFYCHNCRESPNI
ncbi:Calcium-responsive transcription factor [Oopsacas minuta]|uniref:Calcium-responsive transcription factor n=1 Tax=Oopsacas minuta TaxID=111878 RepID=A0AAV7JHE7_9METZ|nr:Calcium-responsive transcription factor [Oopsacas minuta]